MTSDEINALPERVRAYIHALEARADPAGEARALWAARENAAALAVRVRELEACQAPAMADLRADLDLIEDVIRKAGGGTLPAHHEISLALAALERVERLAKLGERARENSPR